MPVTPPLVRFGLFELDLTTSELWKNGRKLKLQEQPARLLNLLLQNPGEIVTRDKLKEALWSADTFVDFDHSLNAAVAKLRQVLGDSAENPRFIETLARRGYRFIAPVEFVGNSVITPAQELGVDSLTTVTPSRSSRRLALLAAAACTVLLLGAYLVNQSRSEVSRFLPSVPLTSLAGSEISPSFSPDGNRIAFAWDAEGQDRFDIYVKEVGSGKMVQLTHDPRPEVSPEWSPDGHSIAFVRIVSEESAEILVVPAQSGGAARVVAQIDASGLYYLRKKLLTWSADSKSLILTDGLSPNVTHGLFLLSLASGHQTRLTFPPPQYDDLAPALSPEGAKLAFIRCAGRTSGDVYVLPLAENARPLGSPDRITFLDRQIGTPAWTPDSRDLLFTRYEMPGLPSLWRLRWDRGRTVEPLPISADSSSSLALSRDGHQLVYTREALNVNLWAIRLHGRLPLDKPRRWTSTSFVDYNPQFSPDGQQIAFSSTRSGHSEIWICGRDGSQARQMTRFNGTVSGFPRWSPDGKSLVFHVRQKTVAVLYTLDLEGETIQPLLGNSGNDFSPSWSHDGKWIYFCSRRTGDMQVWKVRRNGGWPEQMTHHGGVIPLESPDGQSLYYSKLNPQGLWRQPAGGGEETKVFEANLAANSTAYAVGNGEIYFVGSSGETSSLGLYCFDLRTARIKRLTDIPAPIELGLALSPDEQLILYSQLDHVESDLMLVEKFRSYGGDESVKVFRGGNPWKRFLLRGAVQLASGPCRGNLPLVLPF